MSPVLMFVTDRHRYGGNWEHALVEHIRAAAVAGVHLLQIRERGLDARELTRLVERCVAAARGSRARVIVNDRLDLALAAGAAGVHLPASSLPAGRVRSVVPRGFLVGRSVHSVDEAVQHSQGGCVDYLVYGTVFPSASKPGAPGAGLTALQATAAAVRCPVLAIGGVTLAQMPEVAATGASGVAAIGLFADVATGTEMTKLVEQVTKAFDTLHSVS